MHNISKGLFFNGRVAEFMGEVISYQLSEEAPVLVPLM